MFNLNQVINLNVQSQSSHHIIIHPQWELTAPAGSAVTGNHWRALLHGCSHRLTWTGCFLTGTNGCGLVLFPWGCVVSVIKRLSLMVICARGLIWHNQLMAVPSVNRIPNLHFVASWTSSPCPLSMWCSLQTCGLHAVKLFYLIDLGLLFFRMISLKAVRNQLFIRHDGVSNDDEFLFWYNLNQSSNLNIPYDSYPDFNFDDLI